MGVRWPAQTRVSTHQRPHVPMVLACRRAWGSWAMSPQHAVHVVQAAWLLVALVFRQEDACAAALQVSSCVDTSGGRQGCTETARHLIWALLVVSFQRKVVPVSDCLIHAYGVCVLLLCCCRHMLLRRSSGITCQLCWRARSQWRAAACCGRRRWRTRRAGCSGEQPGRHKHLLQTCSD